MSETEQNKRRFAVSLSGEIAMGVECETYEQAIYGLVFFGSRLVGSQIRFTVLSVAPGHYLSFYELADSDGWPEPVEFILSEEGRRKK